MKAKLNYDDKILVAGGYGLAGSSIIRALKKNGYGDNSLGGEILNPKRA